MLLRSLLVCLLAGCYRTKSSPPVIQTIRPTTLSSPCNLPAEPAEIGDPIGHQAEVDKIGDETGRVITPFTWWAEVYVHRADERAWRRAAKACIKALQK